MSCQGEQSTEGAAVDFFFSSCKKCINAEQRCTQPTGNLRLGEIVGQVGMTFKGVHRYKWVDKNRKVERQRDIFISQIRAMLVG